MLKIKSIYMEITIGIKIPITPNFIITDRGDSIPIQELSDSELSAIGEEWTQKLINAAHTKRNIK